MSADASNCTNNSCKCNLCEETFSVLRYSTICNICLKKSCSSCCRPSAQNPSARICILCSRKQAKKEDPNDDRPKWLREAQDLRNSQHSSDSNAVHPSSSAAKANHVLGTVNKKQADTDDRPKWLREAQEQRNSSLTAQQIPSSSSSFSSSFSSSAVIAGPNHEIESRLANLKHEMNVMKPTATDEQLMERMAKLRDQNPKDYSASRQPDHSILLPRQHLTEAEEIELLVAQMKERATLDETKTGDEDDLVEELERRLNRLKADSAALGIKSSSIPTNSSPRVRPRDSSPSASSKMSKKQRILTAMTADSDEEEAEKIQRIFAQNLPHVQTEDKDKDDGDDGEERFCVICPKEPTVICFDCDKEMYCDRCYRECHKEWGEMNHRTKKLPRIKSSS